MIEDFSINNVKEGRKIGFSFTLIIVALGSILVSSLLYDVQFGLIIQIVSVILLIIIFLLFRLGGFAYLIIELKNNLLEIKFYSVFPFGRKYRMIRANIAELEKVEIVQGFMGLRKGLLLFQKKTNGVAKYPVVWITGINKSDFEKINRIVKIT